MPTPTSQPSMQGQMHSIRPLPRPRAAPRRRLSHSNTTATPCQYRSAVASPSRWRYRSKRQSCCTRRASTRRCSRDSIGPPAPAAGPMWLTRCTSQARCLSCSRGRCSSSGLSRSVRRACYCLRGHGTACSRCSIGTAPWSRPRRGGTSCPAVHTVRVSRASVCEKEMRTIGLTFTSDISCR